MKTANLPKTLRMIVVDCNMLLGIVLDLLIPYILFGEVRAWKRKHISFMRSIYSAKINTACACMIVGSFSCPLTAWNTFGELHHFISEYKHGWLYGDPSFTRFAHSVSAT